MKAVLMLMFWALCLLQMAAKGGAEKGGEVTVDKMTVPVVSIQDPSLIDFFVSEFFIAETLVTRLEIIDATRNGFGEDDLVKTYPSEQIYFPVPSDSAQKIMNSWRFKANFQIVTENRAPEEFENLPQQKAENGILASILRGVNRNYQDQPINIWFQRDSSGVTFEMWGFKESALTYSPPPPPVPDSVVTYDLVHVIRSDTLLNTDSTLYDLIYVYKTVSDTLYFDDGVKVE
ncbi:MAG: hypothetical protein D6743_02525 [Calditrichaeota bacterium]|nr:MAG: hypothetical protein D6743_02525 [Calditrichota bacterium]